MGSSFKKKKTAREYYDEELRYLDEAAREFAEVYPQRARFLNLNQLDDRDPYVERLFEGVAFLNGRIRQKLDDELPELTQSLLGLLWPHFLRPIPSFSILEFNTISDRSQEPFTIERGAEVASDPVRGLHICRFRTCYDVRIRPITLVEAVLENSSIIRFRFHIEAGADYDSLFAVDDLSPPDDYQRHLCRCIRLFIHNADQPTASTLHLYLTNYVQKSVIRPSYGGAEVVIQGQTGFLFPVGDYDLAIHMAVNLLSDRSRRLAMAAADTFRAAHHRLIIFQTEGLVRADGNTQAAAQTFIPVYAGDNRTIHLFFA